jgi:DNA replication and repair protein RecF
MFVKLLKAANFRNYSSLEAGLSPGINVFYGENGSGKTNVIEALYWLSFARSFRISEDSGLVMHSKEACSACASVSDSGLDKEFSAEYSITSRKKTLKENNNRLKRVSDIIGKLPVVLFSPENIFIVKGEPINRRKFIDDLLSQVSPEYYAILNKYLKEVSHRNYLLKGIREGRLKKEMLEVWNHQVMENGIKILELRVKAVAGLNSLLASELLKGRMDITLKYASKNFEDFSDSGLRQAYKKFFSENLNEEIARASTLCGPHRDDIEISFSGRSAKLYASEGQQRVSAILLKLSEGLFIKNNRGSYPVVLLDDFSSELDNPNRQFVGSTFGHFKQIIITTTYTENLKGFDAAKIYRVSEGRLTEEQ